MNSRPQAPRPVRNIQQLERELTAQNRLLDEALLETERDARTFASPLRPHRSPALRPTYRPALIARR